jgi:hypothetical protein
VIECDFTDRADVVKAATSGDFALRLIVPIVVVPSLNVTDPVGVPVAGAMGATVAVKVTDSPLTDEILELVRVVVVVMARGAAAAGRIRRPDAERERAPTAMAMRRQRGRRGVGASCGMTACEPDRRFMLLICAATFITDR